MGRRNVAAIGAAVDRVAVLASREERGDEDYRDHRVLQVESQRVILYSSKGQWPILWSQRVILPLLSLALAGEDQGPVVPLLFHNLER